MRNFIQECARNLNSIHVHTFHNHREELCGDFACQTQQEWLLMFFSCNFLSHIRIKSVKIHCDSSCNLGECVFIDGILGIDIREMISM
jgi:hypothetical protein